MRLIPADRQDEENQILAKIKHGEAVDHIETVRRTRDGRLLDVSVTASPIKDATGKIIGASKISRDITVAKEREREIVRLSRLYAALSQVNQAIVWTPQRDEMLEKICRVLVEDGGFHMAWIGQPDAETRQVKPVAKWGDSVDYLSQTVFMRTTGRRAADRPARLSARRKIISATILPTTPTPFRGMSRRSQAGFRSSAAFPIRQGGAVWGAVSIYSDDPGFFRDKEIALLEEAATDISFALDNLAREKSRRQAEEAVLRSQAEFKDLFDNAPVGFHEINTEGRIVRINNTELKMLGYTTGELLGQFVWKISADVELSRRAALAKLGGELLPPSKGFERMFRRKDGSTFPVLIKDRLLEREDGSITGIRAAIQDITDRRKAEEALDYERDLLRALLDNSPDEIYFKDTQSRFVKCSRAMAAQFGVESPDALVGKTDFDFFDESHARPAYEDEQKILRTGQAMVDKGEREEWKDGRVTWAASTKLPWLDGAGKIIGIIGISRDITERKRAEEALRGSETMLQEAQRIASTGSYSHDIASGHWSSSPVLDDLFGIDVSYERSVAGWAALVHPDDRAMMVDHFEKEVLGQQRPFNKEYRIVRHNDQAQRWMHALGKLEFDADRPSGQNDRHDSGHHRTPETGGAIPPGAKDGGHRPARRRRGA